VEGGVENRVSNGQVLLAAADAGKEASNRLQEKAEQDRIQDVRSQKSHTALRLERLEAEETADRDSLFGGMMEKATNYVFSQEEEDAKRPAEQFEGLAASLGQTRDAVNRRVSSLLLRSNDSRLRWWMQLRISRVWQRSCERNRKLYGLGNTVTEAIPF
jgi:hypothetical protein